MRKWSLVGAWVVVLILTTGLTWQIVSAADNQVTNPPTAALNVNAPTGPSDPPSTPATSQPPATTGNSGPDTSDQVKPGGSTTSTSTTTTSETNGSAAGDWKIKTISTSGGTVVVTYRPGEVVLQTATPKPGFRAEIDKGGPPKVEVEFESDDDKAEVKAEWKDGALDVEIDED